MKVEKSIKLIISIVLMMSVLIPGFILCIYQDVIHGPLLTEEAKTLVNDFYYLDEGKKVLVSLPESVPTIEGTSLVYRILPDDIGKNEYLLVWSSQKSLVVSIDNQPVYTYSTEDFPSFLHLGGFHYHMIPLPKGSSGKLLSIQMTFLSTDTGYSTYREVYYGTQAGIFKTLSATYGLYFVMSIAVFLSSIITILLYITFRRFFANNRGLLYLGIFTGLLSIWFIEQSRLQQFFLYAPILQAFLVYGSLLLLPIPIVRFLEEISERKDDRGLFIIQMISAVMFLVFMALQFLGIRDLTASNYPVTILCIFLGLYIIYFMIREIKGGNKELKSYLNAFVCLVVGVIIEFLYKVTVDNAPSFFIQVGLLLFMYFLIVNIFNKALRRLEIANEAMYYQKLALYDFLTETYNRTAYYRFVDQFDDNERNEKHYCMIVFDLNDLKIVNDHYGHREGDVLIASFATCLKSVFEGYGEVYRVGGDEFVAILTESCPEKVGGLMTSLKKKSEVYDLVNGKLSYAYGISFFRPQIAADFNLAMHLADEKMYAMKEEMK